MSPHYLPHPVRVTAPMEDILEKIYDGGIMQRLAPTLMDLSRPLRYGIAELQRQDPTLDAFMRATAGPHDVNYGSFVCTIRALQHKRTRSPIFTIDDMLLADLERTDLDEGLPVQFLRPPFPLIYLELGRRRDLPYALHDADGASYPLEGAYIHHIPATAAEPERLEVVLCGMAPPHSDPWDDFVTEVSLDFSDPERSVHDAFDVAHAWIVEKIGRESSTFLWNSPEQLLECLRPISKAMLYLNCDGIRTELRTERSELERRLVGLKSEHKRRKLAHKLAQAYDCIYVTRHHEPGSTHAAQGTERHVSAHWRRGHFRNQVCGTGRLERRLRWIAPMLVGTGELRPKHYKVQ